MAKPVISIDPIITRRLSIAGIVALLFCLSWQTDSLRQAYRFSETKTDYYNLLTEGFIRGSTAMHVAVDPGMLSPDPEVRRVSPSLLDANLYQGKYYLYYGVVPALSFFTPYRLLTGHNLAPELAVLIGVLMGYFIVNRIWKSVRTRYFPKLGSSCEFAVQLLLGLSTATPFLITRSSFYEVPIAAGYACIMWSCLACYQALHYRPHYAIIALGTSSLALGLAVGCRPNYILVLPALLVVAYIIIKRRHAWVSRPSKARIILVAILPATIIGAGLAFYNFARFGNPIEFGFNYGINSFFDSGATLMSWHFILPNLQWIYFTPPQLSPYFPYVSPVAGSFRPPGYFGNEAFHGQFFSLILLIWILLGIASSRRAKTNIRKIVFIIFLAWIGLSSLQFMSLLTIRGNRYVVDFQAAFMLLGAITVGWTWSAIKFHQIVSVIWRLGLIAITAISSLFNVLGSIQQFDQFSNTRPVTFKKLARFFDPLAYKLANELIEKPHGPIKFQAVFSPKKIASTEPLIIAGLSEYTDSIYATQHPDNNIEIIMDHHGYGGPRSKLIPIEIGRSYNFEVDLGAFYPPQHHHFFDSYDAYSSSVIKSIVEVKIDGQIILDKQVKSYDAPLNSISIGLNNTTNNPYSRNFSGKINNIVYSQNIHTSNKAKLQDSDGILELQIQFNPSTLGTNQPIITTGITGAGNLLFARIKSNNEIQIGLDAWGYGGPLSDSIKLNTAESHIIKLFIGPIISPRLWEDHVDKSDITQKLKQEIQIWIDGQIAFKTIVQYHEDSLNQLNVGSNHQGFSTAVPLFSGKIDIRPISLEAKKAFIKKILISPQ